MTPLFLLESIPESIEFEKIKAAVKAIISITAVENNNFFNIKWPFVEVGSLFSENKTYKYYTILYRKMSIEFTFELQHNCKNCDRRHIDIEKYIFL